MKKIQRNLGIEKQICQSLGPSLYRDSTVALISLESSEGGQSIPLDMYIYTFFLSL